MALAVGPFPSGPYRCIVADPPWHFQPLGRFKAPKHGRPGGVPYETMTVEAICALPVASLVAEGAHLWLWTTNLNLPDAVRVMEAWSAKYMTIITWVKPSGFGAYWANTTQHVLFGYYGRCMFKRERYLPTHFFATPKRHSEKPVEFYAIVRRISEGPALDLFARRDIPGFDLWGNEAPTERQGMLPLEVPA